MERAENEEVFHKIVRLINDFKQYFIDHRQPVYENPSPGNKAGGITTWKINRSAVRKSRHFKGGGCP